MTTLRQELVAAAESLAEVGVDTPRLDAELLLAYVLGVDRAQLVIRAEEEASADLRTRYLALLTRRVKREPIAYILRKRDFRRLTLLVDPRVLIPRPETELLVEVGLSLPQGARVLDVGTGSGAIALALKDERPDLDVVGADLSAGALSVARMNATRLRLAVEWLQGDLLEPLEHGSVRSEEVDRVTSGVDRVGLEVDRVASEVDRVGLEVDAVLANLPYIAADDLLQPEVALYEPQGALLAGEDGLDLIRRLLEQVEGRDRIRLIALEVGAGQAPAVAALVGEAGFGQIERMRDLAGHERVVVGRR